MDLDIFNLTHPSNYLVSVSAGTFGSVGLIGNFVLIVLIMSDYKNRKPYEWLLLALAANDFILSLTCVAMECPFIINFNRVECKVSGAIAYLVASMALHIPPIIAYNRYLSLYDQPKCARLFTRRNILIGCVFLLVFDFVFWISPFIAMDSLGQDELGTCGLQIRNKFLTGIMLVLCTSDVMVYCFLIYCSRKVIIKIRGHKKGATTRSQIQSRLITESREIIIVVTITAILPLFSQVPAVAVKILQIFTPYFGPWINRSSVAPYSLTAAVNAYVTMYVIKTYRRSVMNLVKRVKLHVTGTGNAVGQGINVPGTNHQ